MKKRSYGTFAVLTLLLPQFASALPYPGRTPANKLTASDAADFDAFGRSVAVSGNLALVGADFENGAGDNLGAAYVFDLSTGAELFKLTASDADNSDFFGESVALSGTLAIVGAPFEDGAGIDRGAAYVFDLTTGTELRKFIGTDTENSSRFGGSVAISGNVAIVGASSENGDGNDRGAAYVYDLTTGDELFRFVASNTADSNLFGVSVAVSGNLALVGAFLENGEGNNRGAAYVYDLTTGAELFKLTASDAADGDEFGGAVAVSGTLAVVGALQEDGGGNGRGAAYVFDLMTGAELFKLVAADAENGDQFGMVAVSGTIAVIGAPNKDGAGAFRGATYVYDLTTGEELFKLTASDAENNDIFGRSVAISGTNAVVGASSEDGNGSGRGAAYVFEIPDRRPDLLSGAAPFSGMGRGVFNTSGAGQSTTLTSRRLSTVSGFFTLTGGGDTPDDCLLAATPGNRDFALRYFRRNTIGETNTTATLLTGTQLERNVAPGESGRVYRTEVTPSKRLKKRLRGRVVFQRKSILVRLTATSQTHTSRKDVAAISVGTR